MTTKERFQVEGKFREACAESDYGGTYYLLGEPRGCGYVDSRSDEEVGAYDYADYASYC